MGGSPKVKGRGRAHGTRSTGGHTKASARKFKGVLHNNNVTKTTTSSATTKDRTTTSNAASTRTEVKITDLDAYTVATNTPPAKLKRTVAPAPKSKPKARQSTAPVTVRPDMSLRALNLIRNASQMNPMFARLADFVRKAPAKTLSSMSRKERKSIGNGAWETFIAKINLLYALGVHHNDVKRSNITWDGQSLRLINFHKAELGVRSADDLRRAQDIRHYDAENPQPHSVVSKLAVKDRPTSPVFVMENSKIFMEFPGDTAKINFHAKGGTVAISRRGNNYKIENKSGADIYLFRGGDASKLVTIAKGQSRIATHDDVIQIGQGAYTLRKTSDRAGVNTGQPGTRTLAIKYLPLPPKKKPATPKQPVAGNNQIPVSGQVTAKSRQGGVVPKAGDANVIVANQITQYRTHRLSPKQRAEVFRWLVDNKLWLSLLTREQQLSLIKHLVVNRKWKTVDLEALAGRAEVQALMNTYLVKPANLLRKALDWLRGNSSGGHVGAHHSSGSKVAPWMQRNIIDGARNAMMFIDGKWVDVVSVIGNNVTYTYTDRSVVPKRRLKRTAKVTPKMLLKTFAELPISQIHPTENGLSPVRLASAHKYIDIPITVYRHLKPDGSYQYFALDGHHRLAALVKSGSQTVRVRFVPSTYAQIQKRINNPTNPAMPVPKQAKDMTVWKARYDDYQGGPGAKPKDLVRSRRR